MECPYRLIGPSVSYFGENGFEFRSGTGYPDWSLTWFSYRQKVILYLKIGHDSFLSHPFEINHSQSLYRFTLHNSRSWKSSLNYSKSIKK